VINKEKRNNTREKEATDEDGRVEWNKKERMEKMR